MIDKMYKQKVCQELSSVLNDHKDHLLAVGVKLPLLPVPVEKKGLLKSLPRAIGKTGWPWDTEIQPSTYETRSTWPKITLVIPSFNQGIFIEEAIRSILLQNYPKLELIVMDGGSKDQTKAILEKYSPWLSFWRSEKDHGQGQAINMGFSLASGDYYGWLNSDDFYNEKAFFVLATEILLSGKGFYYGDALSVDLDNTRSHYWKANWVKDTFLRFGGLIASHSAFWKNTIHQPVWEAMNCNVDGELWIRLVKNQSRKHIKFPIGSIRCHDDTKSAHSKWKTKWKEDDLNIERIHGKPPAPGSLKARLFRLVQKIYKKSF